MHMLLICFRKGIRVLKLLTKSVKSGSDLCVSSTTFHKIFKQTKLIETRFVIFSDIKW